MQTLMKHHHRLTLSFKNKLINAINEYAAAKISINTTLRKESRVSKWYPIKRYELMKFLAVIIGMGIDRRSSIDDYWRLDSIYYTLWFHEVFPRDRFKLIYCMTRDVEQKYMPLVTFKQSLIQSLLCEEENYKPVDYNPHHVSKPTARAPKDIREPHLIICVEPDRNCVHCSSPQLRKKARFKARLTVMSISIQKIV